MNEREIIMLEDKASDQELLLVAPEVSHVIHLALDWKRRIIHVGGEITPGDGERFWTIMEYLGSDPIQVHLNTPGGDVDSMYAMHDAIRRHGLVTVLGYGMVCSAGVLLLACGHNRLVTQSCVLMSHESHSSGGEELGFRASKDRRKFDDWQHEWWCELMGRYTPYDAAWWRKTTDRKAEYWLLGGRQIVEAGLADEVV